MQTSVVRAHTQASWQAWSWRTPEGFLLQGEYFKQRVAAFSELPLKERPVIHFVHGNSYAGLVYEPLWQLILPWCDVFLHNAQGHGESEAGHHFVGWKRSAQYLEEVWRAQSHIWQDRAVYALAHSFGGVLTSVALVKSPQLFKKALLLDPIILPPRLCTWVSLLSKLGLYQRNPFARRALKRRAHWPNAESARQSLSGRGMFKGWHPDALKAYVKHGMQVEKEGLFLKCPSWIEAQIFGSYMPNLWHQLAQLRTPIHFVFGEQSYNFLNQTQHSLQKIAHKQHKGGAKGSAVDFTFANLPGGHCFMLENPALTAEYLLTRFLNLKPSMGQGTQ